MNVSLGNPADLIGWMGSVLMVSAFWTRSERSLNILLGLGLLVLGIHLGMIGATTAAGCAFVSALRCMAVLVFAAGLRPYLAVAACIATIVLSLHSWNGWQSGLVLAAMLATNVVLVVFSGITMRLVMGSVSGIWFASFWIVGSMPGMATETLVAIGNLWCAFQIFRSRRFSGKFISLQKQYIGKAQVALSGKRVLE